MNAINSARKNIVNLKVTVRRTLYCSPATLAAYSFGGIAAPMDRAFRARGAEPLGSLPKVQRQQRPAQ
jgi:hypothetical protein